MIKGNFLVLTEKQKNSLLGKIYGGKDPVKLEPIEIKAKTSLFGLIKTKRFILPVNVLMDPRLFELAPKLTKFPIKTLKTDDFPQVSEIV